MRPTKKSKKKIAAEWIVLFCLGAISIIEAASCSRKKLETAPQADDLYAKAMSYYQGRSNWIGKLFSQSREKYSDTRADPIFTSRNYTRAIDAFQKVIYNYPFSTYAILSELRIADCHYEIEEHEIAGQAYEDFIRFHPVHKEVPYANYRLGLCHYHRMLKPGRDQTETENALVQFQLLLISHPESEYVEEARPLIKDCEERLARHNFKIARFYFKQKNYWAAAARFEKAWQLFPETEPAEEAIFKQAQCQDRLSRYQNALALYDELLSQFPEGSYRDEALSRKKELILKNGEKNTIRE